MRSTTQRIQQAHISSCMSKHRNLQPVARACRTTLGFCDELVAKEKSEYCVGDLHVNGEILVPLNVYPIQTITHSRGVLQYDRPSAVTCYFS